MSADTAELIVREARPEDSEALAGLIVALGYQVTAADVFGRIGPLSEWGMPPLVAVRGAPIGCLTWTVMRVLHRPRPVGRISMMVVAERERGRGVGTALVDAVCVRLRDEGCGLIEVTSNFTLAGAHDFYEGLGFERTSYRFAKALV